MSKLFLSFVLFLSLGFSLTAEEEKQLLRDVAEIKATLKTFMEQVDKRFEQVDKRFDDMFNFLWILTGIFTTLTASVIAFAWWDRRTIIRKARDETIDYLRKEDLKKLVEVLREKAKTDQELARILKQYGLL
ncbi:hypothetical protein [Aquifex sp.]